MMFQNKDADYSAEFVNAFHHKVEEKEAKLAEIEKGPNQFEQMLSEARQELENLPEQVAE